jgi:putative NIF3 family GTP cyclohydrolase 1 type 2
MMKIKDLETNITVMKISEIYELAINLGVQNDLRGANRVQAHLDRVQKKYNELSDKQKELFDTELLKNPYPDSRVLHNHDREVKKVLVGIDMEGPELMLAQQMGDIDLVIAHHPEGRGLSDLSACMELQAEVLAMYGVPINIAQGLLEPRISEVARGVNPINHFRAVDLARHLDMGFMCVHTPCDNMVATFLKKRVEAADLTYVSDVFDILEEIPEYKAAAQDGLGPLLFAGKKDNYCGKVAITEITGGTEGTPEVYERLASAGIGTIVGMHMSERHTKAAKKAHINALIAGHMSSDSIGVNLFLDHLAAAGIEIVTTSGLIRVERDEKTQELK